MNPPVEHQPEDTLRKGPAAQCKGRPWIPQRRVYRPPPRRPLRQPSCTGSGNRAEELVQVAADALARWRSLKAVYMQLASAADGESTEEAVVAARTAYLRAIRAYMRKVGHIGEWVCRRMGRGMSLEDMGLTGIGSQSSPGCEQSAAWWLHQEFLEVCREIQTQRRRRVMYELNGRLLRTLPAWLEQREAKQWGASSI